MPDFLNIEDALAWIESHPGSVDLFKWILVVFAAWALGLFKYARRKFKSPRIEIEELTSRCHCESFDELEGSSNVVRAIFLLQISVTNPTTDPIVIKDFWLRYRTHRRWRWWTDFMLPTTLPNRPRQTVGGSTKLLRVWFSRYQDDPTDIALDGRIEPREHQSGYVLFVSSTWGTHNPIIQDEKLFIEVNAKLTTGETLKSRARIRQIKDREYLDNFVPGILTVAAESNAQNLFRRA